MAPSAASASVQTYTQTVGPIQVGGYEVKQGGAVAPHPPVDGHITNMEVDVVEADGTPVPIQRLMLHHIVFANGDRPNATCDSILGFDSQGSFPAAERFYGAGEERAKMALPPGYGYRLNGTGPGQDSWRLAYMLMNHRATTDQAYIQYKVTVNDDPSLESVTPYWLDVENCQADPIYNVPGTKKKGSKHTQSWDFVAPEAGRIVGGGGHVHGGARTLTLTQPDCGDRKVGESLPTWGKSKHPFYNVRPVLHEPGPISMSGFQSQTGIPVAEGQRLRLNSLYDNSLPHVRVMGIMLVYVAPDPGVQGCESLPGDVQTLETTQPGREGPVRFKIPLTALDEDGSATTIKRPPGELSRLGRDQEITVGDRFFSSPNVLIKRGAEVDWRFTGQELHNVTLANGPKAIGSPNLDDSRVHSERFNRAGTYRLFCGLHPVQMSERIVVRGRKRGRGK